MYKAKPLRTYGRHKNRVITSESWFIDADKDKGLRGIFTTSDDSSGQSSLLHSSSGSGGAASSLNSTGNSTRSMFSNRIQTRSTRKLKQSANKENKQPHLSQKGGERVKQQESKTKMQIWNISSSSNNSEQDDISRKTRALRDRNQKIDYNDSANLKKQLRGTLAKRKRAVKTKKEETQHKEASVNFSDFDNYSLVISDSPAVDRAKMNNDRLCVETSTPVGKRTRCKETSCSKMKVADISHIEVVPSPGSGISFASVDSPESAHSQSVYDTPSVLSSINSENASNCSSKKIENASHKISAIPVVQLRRLRENGHSNGLIGSGKSPSLASRTRSGLKSTFNNSESLFNSPSVVIKNDISELTAHLRKMRQRQLYNDSLIGNTEAMTNETGDHKSNGIENEVHCDDEEIEEESDDDDEETDSDDEEETDDDDDVDSDLSAIHEIEEGSETENMVTDEELDITGENDTESESDSESSNVKKRETRNTRKQKKLSPTVDLERLSESLLWNHVNKRKTWKRNTRQTTVDNSEMDELADCLDQSHIDARNELADCSESPVDSSNSNVSLYILNERQTRNKTSDKCSVNDLTESLEKSHIDVSDSERLNESHENSRTSGDNSELDDLTESLEKSNIESSGSNCTLYMLNEANTEKSRGSTVSELSMHEEFDEEEHDVSKKESVSASKPAYQLALSHGEDNYHTADEQDMDSEQEEEEKSEEVVHSPPRRKYSLREKFQDLQNSFSEILTPKRRKSSLVPLSAEARVYLLCDQTEPITFREALSRKMITKCKKIGEGVYGEVFRSINEDGETVAIKIIPIEGDFNVNDEPQKKFAEILPEIVIAKELSNLRNKGDNMTSNFCQVNSVSCVKGKYPEELIKQWDIYHKNRKSENDRPDVFPKKQLFIVFEFADCGSDLESYKFQNIYQARSVLAQVAYSLAIAEDSLQFEHRDLHWGNVLIRPTDEEDISFKLLGVDVTIPSFGVVASVIDFTMSRLSKDGCTVYISLADDDTLFQGQGDYQFDIYREMKKENGNDWKKFCPHTNVLWLHYLADKLVYSTTYPSQSGREDREVLRQFRQFISTMLTYKSAAEMATDALFLNS